MQIIVTPKDQYALKQEQHVVLHELMQEKELDLIKTAMELHKDDRWHHSRDLFRQFKDVLKALSRPYFVNVVGQMINENPFRLIFDQMLFPMDEDSVLPKIFHQTEKFESQFCYQGIQLGILLCIDESKDASGIFELSRGSALFFTSRYELTFEPLLNMKSGNYLLLAYGRDPIVFRECTDDPFQKQMRKLGLHFGDKLNNDLHPQFFTKN